MNPFEDRYRDAENVIPIGKEPVKVVATPYAWRDPRSIPRRPWIFGHQIARQQAGGKFAPGGAGKTTHEIGVCLSLATGDPFLGPRVWGGPKRAWLWNLEDNGDELARSIQAACIRWKISEADIAGRLFVDSALEGAVLKLATQTANGGIVINEPLVDALVEELIARGIDYLSVDPFISSHSVEENDNGAIDAVVKKWAQVAKRANCGITLTHHVKKLGGKDVTSEDARGASSLVAACRSALVLNRMSTEEAKGWVIQGEERRRYFRVYDDKNNRAPPADSSDWYQLVSVDLDNGDEHHPSDKIGVAEPWYPPVAMDSVRQGDLYEVQKLIKERGNCRANGQATRWVGKLVAEVMGLDVKNPSDRKTINSVLGTWKANGAIVEITRPDKNGDDRAFIEVGYWGEPSTHPRQPAPPAPEVRTGAEGADSNSRPAPAPPIYRGAGVRVAVDPSAGADRGAGAGARKGLSRVVFPAPGEEPPPHARFPHGNPALGPADDEDDPAVDEIFGKDR